MKTEIRVVPVGKVETEVLEHISTALRLIFNQECHLGEGLPKPDYAFNPSRGQYSSNKVLCRLSSYEAERVLGVIDLDLYVPGLNFVFGLADQFGKRGIIALARLHQKLYGLPEDRELFLQRAVKEAVHELGHTYGLSHCNDRRCVMAFSNSLVDTDYKGPSFCHICHHRYIYLTGTRN